MPDSTNERILCCLETWVNELRKDKNDSASKWVVMTYDNEIINGEYVSDEEFAAWMTKREKRVDAS